MSVFEKIQALLVTLDKEERRRFSLTADSQALYYRLYEALCKYPEQEEAAVAKRMKLTAQDRSFVHAKTYLFQLLEEFLLSNATALDTRLELLRKHQLLFILFQRGCYDLVRKPLQKYIEEATQLEMYEPLLLLLELERQLILLHANPKKVLALTQQNMAVKQHALRAYNTLSAYRTLYLEIDFKLRYVALMATPADAEPSLLQHPLLQTPPPESERSSLFTYLMSKALACLHYGLLPDAERYAQQAYDLDRKHAGFLRCKPECYITFWHLMQVNFAHRNHIDNLWLAERMQEYLPEDWVPRHVYLHGMLAQYNTRVTGLAARGDYHLALADAKEGLDWMAKHADDADVYLQHQLQLHTAAICLIQQENTLGLSLIKKLLAEPSAGLRLDIYLFALICRLLLHVQEGSWEVIPHECRNLRRMLKKHNAYTPLVDLLVQYALKLEDPKSAGRILSALKKAVAEAHLPNWDYSLVLHLHLAPYVQMLKA